MEGTGAISSMGTAVTVTAIGIGIVGHRTMSMTTTRDQEGYMGIRREGRMMMRKKIRNQRWHQGLPLVCQARLRRLLIRKRHKVLVVERLQKMRRRLWRQHPRLRTSGD